MEKAADALTVAVRGTMAALDEAAQLLDREYEIRYANTSNPIDLKRSIEQLKRELEAIQSEAAAVQAKQEQWSAEMQPLLEEAALLTKQLQQRNERENEPPAPAPTAVVAESKLLPMEPVAAARSAVTSRARRR